MTKKKLLLIILIVLCIGVFFLEEGKPADNYSPVVKANWDISIPYGYEITYEKDDSIGSAFGDGNRYRVMQYTQNVVFNDDIVWLDKLEEEELLKKTLAELQVTVYPPLSSDNCKFFYTTENNNSMWLIFNTETNKLYVIERMI